MYRYLIDISTFSILIPLLGLIIVRSHNLKGGHYLKLFIIASFLFELLFYTLSKFHTRNVQFSHLYSIVEFTILFLFFRNILNIKKGGFYPFTAYLIYLLINPFLFEDMMSFNPMARSLSCLIFIFLSLSFFFKLYQEEEILEPVKNPLFIIVIALFIYYSASIFTFVLINETFFTELEPNAIHNSFFFHSLSNVLKNILITVALWMARDRQVNY